MRDLFFFVGSDGVKDQIIMLKFLRQLKILSIERLAGGGGEGNLQVLGKINTTEGGGGKANIKF